MIVDDRPENLFAFEQLLKSNEIEIIKAQGGKAALNELMENDIDFVLLDVQMPDMDGFEVARLMRMEESTKDIPIIFITASYSEKDKILKGYEGGAVDFILKPIDNELLLAKVKNFCQLFKENRRELASMVLKLQKLNIELETTKDALLRSSMAKTEFINNMSHELRTPLNGIIGMNGLLLDAPLGKEYKEYVEMAQRSADKLHELVNNVLDFSKLEEGLLVIENSPFNLGSAVETVTRSFHSELQKKGISFSLSTQPEVPFRSLSTSGGPPEQYGRSVR